MRGSEYFQTWVDQVSSLISQLNSKHFWAFFAEIYGDIHSLSTRIMIEIHQFINIFFSGCLLLLFVLHNSTLHLCWLLQSYVQKSTLVLQSTFFQNSSNWKILQGFYKLILLYSSQYSGKYGQIRKVPPHPQSIAKVLDALGLLARSITISCSKQN